MGERALSSRDMRPPTLRLSRRRCVALGGAAAVEVVGEDAHGVPGGEGDIVVAAHRGHVATPGGSVPRPALASAALVAAHLALEVRVDASVLDEASTPLLLLREALDERAHHLDVGVLVSTIVSAAGGGEVGAVGGRGGVHGGLAGNARSTVKP